MALGFSDYLTSLPEFASAVVYLSKCHLLRAKVPSLHTTINIAHSYPINRIKLMEW